MNHEMTLLPLLGQTPDPGDVFRLIAALLAWALWFAAILGPVALVHLLFTLPMRRSERARLFLDLVEDALRHGRSIEDMMLSVARYPDRSLGARFHLSAAYIEAGMGFREAVKAVPGFLSPQITEMLLAGERLGDVRRVLPACREILRDRPAGVRSAVHYMLLVVLFFSPIFIAVVILESVFVVPRFRDIAVGMNIKTWPETAFVFGNAKWFVVFELVVFLALVLATMLYIGGPRFARLFQFQGFPLADWVAWRLPWKQKRLQRTFSAMLAVLLDGGLPEGEAVHLAGDCTANEICRKRAGEIVTALGQGVNLEEAVRVFDDSGEFHWRLANAAHSRGGLLNALRGWHEALDAKAFQEEEASAHAITTGVVILNGLLVGLIATAMFGLLVAAIRGGLSL